MSNGYLAAAAADLTLAHEIGEGFGLDVINASAVRDRQTVGAALAEAANVGVILSLAAAHDQTFVTLLAAVAPRLARAQLILVEPEARAAFAFLPETWPAMSLDEARTRAQALARSREAPPAEVAGEPPRAAPLPVEPPPDVEQEPAQDQAEAPTDHEGVAIEGEPRQPPTGIPEDIQSETLAGDEAKPPAPDIAPAPAPDIAAEEAPPATLDQRYGDMTEAMRGGADPTFSDEYSAHHDEDGDAVGRTVQPAPSALASQAPSTGSPPLLKEDAMLAEAARSAPRQRKEAPGGASGAGAANVPADATAFAPKKLRHGSPELVRIAIHQPKHLQAVIKAARKIDPRAAPAPHSMGIGDVALGASVGVSLEVRGGDCKGELQRRIWAGEPIDFSFSVEADADAKQVVLLARVFVDDAQIGVLAFTRPISGPKPSAASDGERVRLKRHKRVFLSYSSKDRETVSAIATAYRAAGVHYFWDRTSLKSGEEWSPRLRQEIDRADLFHLCWSKAAAASPWVEKEAEHALSRRRRAKKPDITVQMLDGPPWAPHPRHLDSINFDDFVRAAIVGYARGEQ